MKQQLASSKTVLVRTVRTGNQAAYLRSKTEIGLLLPLSPSSQQAAMFPQREYVKDDPNLVPKLTAHSVLGAKMEIHARRDCLSRIGMIPIWSVPLSMLGWIDHIGRMVDWSINGDLETHSKDSHCVMDDHKTFIPSSSPMAHGSATLTRPADWITWRILTKLEMSKMKTKTTGDSAARTPALNTWRIWLIIYIWCWMMINVF